MFHNTGITAETSSVPLVVKGAQPVWLTLNDARERAFTGEIVFETDPEVFAYLDHGIEFHRVPVVDGDSEHLAARLHEIVDLLHRLLADGRRVYLHCNAGFNRAPTVAIAYLHVHGGLGLEEAERVVKAHRPCVPYRRALELAFRPAR